MAMWLRLGGALVVTLVVIALIEVFGAGPAIGERTAGDVQNAAHGRPREVFWFLIFSAVMATSLLAAARRGARHLRRAISRRG